MRGGEPNRPRRKPEVPAKSTPEGLGPANDTLDVLVEIRAAELSTYIAGVYCSREEWAGWHAHEIDDDPFPTPPNLARRPLVGRIGNFAWWFDGNSLCLAQAHSYSETPEL